jgi:two-component system OmpR family response regulator
VRDCVLVAAQDMALRAKIARLLQSAGYVVELASSEKRALELVANGKIKVAIVATRPGLAGLAFARELGGRVPRMIVLAERPEDITRLGRSLTGAHISLSQQLDEQQLLDNVSQAMGSPGGDATASMPEALRIDGCRLDFAACAFVKADGREAPLTRAELMLIAVFARNPGKVLSRDQLSHAMAPSRMAAPSTCMSAGSDRRSSPTRGRRD